VKYILLKMFYLVKYEYNVMQSNLLKMFV